MSDKVVKFFDHHDGAEQDVSAEENEKLPEHDEFPEEAEGQLTIDVYQTPDEIIIESPIAGVDSEDLDVHITNESVTIKGKRERAQVIEEEDYFYQECYWGRFSRSIILPQEIDADKSEATIKNGVLTVKMPKLNRQKTRKLKVRTHEA